MRSYLLPFFCLLFMNPSDAQILHERLYKAYENYKEPSITHRRFKHRDVLPLLEQLKKQRGFDLQVLGQSYEGRDICEVKWGNGPFKVLLWSQMHGDEPTATMALLDIFHFLSVSDDFDALRNELRQQLTLYFIPLLNPDGAERYQRRTALDIDLNRDALRTVTPEGKILKDAVFRLEPDFGFNLHDQSIYYSAGNSDKTATFSFLAPAYNYEKTVNERRADAMKLIVQMDRTIQYYLPGQVAKYNDDFEPRAFGDNIQKWGTRTILIESGGLRNDPEKQRMRKIHFVMLLEAFRQISRKGYKKETTADYFNIPDNDRLFFDLVIRKARLEDEGRSATLDIGYRRDEINTEDAGGFYSRRSIADLGDLSVFKGYEEIEASQLQIVSGEVYPEVFEDYSAFRQINLHELVDRGFTNFKVKNLPAPAILSQLPVRLQLPETETSNRIRYGSNPCFFLHREGTIEYVIHNGQAFEMEALKNYRWPVVP
ncbi:MAG: M14 family zinc carboxypeptidase [Bacteroidota bacterium]